MAEKPDRNMQQIREVLFDTLEKLTDAERPMDIGRAKAVANVAQTIILTGPLQFDAGELDGRIGRALRSGALTERECELLRILAGHRGALEAITSAALAERLGMERGEESRRVITQGVETMRVLHGIPVGASRSKPAGYFLIETRRDLDVALGPLLGEMYAHLRVLRALTGKRDVARLFGQQMLRLDEESESRAQPRDRSGCSGKVGEPEQCR